MTNNETTIYLLKYALEVLENNDLENTRNKDNWVIGRDIEAHLKELMQVENNGVLPLVGGRSEQLNCDTCIDLNNLTGSQKCNDCSKYDKHRAI